MLLQSPSATLNLAYQRFINDGTAEAVRQFVCAFCAAPWRAAELERRAKYLFDGQQCVAERLGHVYDVMPEPWRREARDRQLSGQFRDLYAEGVAAYLDQIPRLDLTVEQENAIHHFRLEAEHLRQTAEPINAGGCFWLWQSSTSPNSQLSINCASKMRQAAESLMAWAVDHWPNETQRAAAGEGQSDTEAAKRLLGIFTDGLSDERFEQAAAVLGNRKLTCDEKLHQIDGLMAIPPTASAATLGNVLGVTKTAIQRTPWYKKKRQGRQKETIQRRADNHRERAKSHEPLNGHERFDRGD